MHGRDPDFSVALLLPSPTPPHSRTIPRLTLHPPSELLKTRPALLTGTNVEAKRAEIREVRS